MADLSPEQLEFVRKHLGYDTKSYFAKKSIKSNLIEFWRRRDKAEAEIKDLPPDDPRLPALKKAIADATKKAEANDVKGAYKDLKSTKETARAAANEARAGVSVASIEADLRVLATTVRRTLFEMSGLRADADSQTRDLIDDAKQMRDPKDGRDREETFAIISENFRDKGQIMLSWDAYETNYQQSLQTIETILKSAPTVGDLTALVAHKIRLLNAKDPSAASKPHKSTFAVLGMQAKNNHLTGTGGEIKAEITQLLTTRRDQLLAEIKTKTTTDLLPAKFTDDSGKPLEGAAAKQAADKMVERFKIAEAREAKRHEEAAKEFNRMKQEDEIWLARTEDNSPIQPSTARPFYTADMMDDANLDITDLNKSPDQIAQQTAAALADAFDEIMQTKASSLPKGVIPDEIFEMSSRSANDWYGEAAKAAGVAFDPDNTDALDPALWDRIKAAGDAMRQTVIEKFPDKAVCTPEGLPTEVKIGGVTYGGITFLGQGGGGKVFRATDPVSKAQIVLKMPNGFDPSGPPDEDTHQDMRTEAANHRAASGGETGTCPDNILAMKGMVMAPNGLPLIAMDLAEAGDTEKFNNVVSGAERSGLISEAARQAMMKEEMRQVITGMKAMQNAGMTHHDLKEANIFIDKDGTFKVADFGLARHVDSRGGKIRDLQEFTPGYQPPELLGEGDVTQKADNFTLGEMLDRMADPMLAQGRHQEKWSTDKAGPQQAMGPDGKPVQVSALTRVINALKDPDPTKRPTLDAVMLTSYFQDDGANHTPEDVDRLRKATAAYTRTVGGETAQLAASLTKLDGEIKRLDASKGDGVLEMKIDNLQRLNKQNQSEKRARERALAMEWVPEEKELHQQAIDTIDRRIQKTQDALDAVQKELGAPKSPTEIEKIDAEIQAKRQQMADIRKQIDEIHQKDAYKDIVKEMEEANKAFA